MDNRSFGGGGGADFPDPAELIAALKKYRKWVWTGLVVVLLVVIGFGSFFQVEPEENAIVLRLGAPVEEAGGWKTFGPGLHLKWPFIDQVHKAAVKRQHNLQFGFRSSPGETSTTSTRGYLQESLMLTGDLKLVTVHWTVIYVIDDLKTYLFEVKDQEATIRDVVQAGMRQIVGDYSLYEVLTDFQPLIKESQDLIQHHLSKTVPTGVLITKVAIVNTDVPGEAKAVWTLFNQTEPKVRGMLKKADAELQTAVGVANRDRASAIGKAERYRKLTVLNAKGEAAAFLSKRNQYKIAPAITKQWMYLKTMTRVLKGMKEKIIIEDSRAGQNVLKMLPLKSMSALGGAK